MDVTIAFNGQGDHVRSTHRGEDVTMTFSAVRDCSGRGGDMTIGFDEWSGRLHWQKRSMAFDHRSRIVKMLMSQNFAFVPEDGLSVLRAS